MPSSTGRVAGSDGSRGLLLWFRRLLICTVLGVGLFATLAFAPPKKDQHLKLGNGYPKKKREQKLARKSESKQKESKPKKLKIVDEEDDGAEADDESDDDDAVMDIYRGMPAAPVITDIVSGYQCDAERGDGQSKVAGGSPNTVAKSVGLLARMPSKKQRNLGKGYEWLHCSGWIFGNIRKSDGGGTESPQQARNFVLGTRYSNEAMIPYEKSLQAIANDCGKTAFVLTATPDREPRRPFLATEIVWQVSNDATGSTFTKRFSTSQGIEGRNNRPADHVAKAEILAGCSLNPDCSVAG